MGCFDDYFAETGQTPPRATEAMASLVVQVNQRFELDPDGGRLHIVLADWNLEEDHIAWCREQQSLSQLEDAIAEQLLALTLPERYVVMAAAEALPGRLDEGPVLPRPAARALRHLADR